jgi:hypothetical protein
MTVTAAGLLVEAADKEAAMAKVNENSIKHLLIFMFYISAT